MAPCTIYIRCLRRGAQLWPAKLATSSASAARRGVSSSASSQCIQRSNHQSSAAESRCAGVASTSGRSHSSSPRCHATAAASTTGTATTDRTISSSLHDGGAFGGGITPRAAYVHLPFCKRKCFYCDFPVEAVGVNYNANSRVSDRMAAYVALVISEIKATSRLADGSPLRTVFFGGGTPSLVPPALLGSILEALDNCFGIDAHAEVCLEADPGTFDLQRLMEYRALGVTRLSVGVQSFQQELLEACGRAHSLDDVWRAIDAVHASGIPSWSLDLMSGLPRLEMAGWQASLDAAVAAEPHHISVYDLQVEEGTPFARWYTAGSRPLPLDDEAADMYAAAAATLSSAGYEHYEVSNYAKPGHRCKHNMTYWHQHPYHAFGLGAASYLEGRRFSRPKQMKQYEAWVGQFAQAGGGVPGSELPQESKEERMLDTLMLSLRTADGLPLAPFAQTYGQEAVSAILPVLERHRQRGLVLFSSGYGGHDAAAAAPSQQRLTTEAAAEPSQGSASGTSKDLAFSTPECQPSGAMAANGAHHNGASVLHSTAGGTATSDVRIGARKADPGGRATSELLLLPGATARLADPAGFLLSNDIISDLFAALMPTTSTSV